MRFSFLLAIPSLFFQISCSSNSAIELNVQRPAQLDVPREVTEIYIRQDLVKTEGDQLNLKEILLQELVNELNHQGRFNAQIVDTLPAEKLVPGQRIGIIQGEIVSGGEREFGQFTELATCKGGIGGRLSAGASIAIGEDALTLDSRAYICRPGGLGSSLIDLGAATLLTGMGVDADLPPVNQVIRTYRYRNISLYTETSFSLTIIGGDQEQRTVAVRVSGGNFGKQMIDTESYQHRYEARPIPGIANLVNRSKIPLIPIPIRELAVVEQTKPKEIFYVDNRLPNPNLNDLPAEEREQILQKLGSKAVEAFLQSISPTTQRIKALIAEGGEEERAEELLRDGLWDEARQRLESLSKNDRTAEDWYNLGLSYEAGAVSRDDYQQARRAYLEALKKENGNRDFAASVGRVERRLAEYRQLASQRAI
ncbi:MAG: hypothetical protein ACO4CF_00275 [bacterium]